jgi:hypothetical protein
VQEGRKLSERVRNEPLDFVKNALVCGNQTHSVHVYRCCEPQNNGTAVHSMASEHLQELGNLVGSERQKQEEVIGVAMGTVYQGEALYL